jgi:hypothetical protein
MNDEIFINSDPGIGNVPVGTICAASNEGRFDAQFLSQPLSTFAIGGWDKDELQALLDFLAPAAPVPRRFSYFSFDAADAFLRDEGGEDIRAIGADFPKVQGESKTEHEGKTDNKGLTIAIDADELAADPTLETRSTTRLIQRLLRNEVRRALALIDATSVNTGKTWNSSADPDRDVLDELELGFAASGNRANRVIYGSTAWSKRDKAYRARIPLAASPVREWGRRRSATTSPPTCAPRISSTVGGSGSLAGLPLGAVVHVPRSEWAWRSRIPATFKRFVTNSGGQAIRIFRQQIGPKKIEITAEHYSRIVVTSTLGVRKFTVS